MESFIKLTYSFSYVNSQIPHSLGQYHSKKSEESETKRNQKSNIKNKPKPVIYHRLDSQDDIDLLKGRHVEEPQAGRWGEQDDWAIHGPSMFSIHRGGEISWAFSQAEATTIPLINVVLRPAAAGCEDLRLLRQARRRRFIMRGSTRSLRRFAPQDDIDLLKGRHVEEPQAGRLGEQDDWAIHGPSMFSIHRGGEISWAFSQAEIAADVGLRRRRRDMSRRGAVSRQMR